MNFSQVCTGFAVEEGNGGGRSSRFHNRFRVCSTGLLCAFLLAFTALSCRDNAYEGGKAGVIEKSGTLESRYEYIVSEWGFPVDCDRCFIPRGTKVSILEKDSFGDSVIVWNGKKVRVPAQFLSSDKYIHSDPPLSNLLQYRERFGKSQEKIDQFRTNPFVNKTVDTGNADSRDRKDRIIAQFGEPGKVETEQLPNKHMPGITDTRYTLKYDRCLFSIFARSVDKIQFVDLIEISNPAYELNFGVVIGMPVSEIVKIFGYPDTVYIDLMAYHDPNYWGNVLTFYFNGSRLKKIEMLTAPD